jgi:hypothetical protein
MYTVCIFEGCPDGRRNPTVDAYIGNVGAPLVVWQPRLSDIVLFKRTIKNEYVVT